MTIFQQAKILSTSAAAIVLTANAAFAQSHSRSSWWNWIVGGGSDSRRSGSGGSSSDRGGFSDVPEIDASAGLLALAAVVAAMLLVWELRRRRARA